MTRLGKGLSALIKEDETGNTAHGSVTKLKIELIKPNEYQPRKIFDPEKLKDLSQSIKENGLIQPIIVSQLDNVYYELIAGERRLEASKMAGLTEIPVVIREVSPREKLVFAIIENVQREDLTPLEEAKAYQQLIDEFEFTHADVSNIMGKDRVTITNTLRLLKLADPIKEMLDNKLITAGHARAILQVEEKHQEEFAQLIVKNGMSVRKAEEQAAKFGSPKGKSIQKPKKSEYSPELITGYEKYLKTHFGKSSKIKTKAKDKGELVIAFKNKNELDAIMKLLETEA